MADPEGNRREGLIMYEGQPARSFIQRPGLPRVATPDQPLTGLEIGEPTTRPVSVTPGQETEHHFGSRGRSNLEPSSGVGKEPAGEVSCNCGDQHIFQPGWTPGYGYHHPDGTFGEAPYVPGDQAVASRPSWKAP